MTDFMLSYCHYTDNITIEYLMKFYFSFNYKDLGKWTIDISIRSYYFVKC